MKRSKIFDPNTEPFQRNKFIELMPSSILSTTTLPNLPSMKITRREFKKALLTYMHVNFQGMKINDEAIRYLRADILRAVRSTAEVDEVLALVLAVLKDRNVRKIRLEHLQQWLGLGQRDNEAPAPERKKTVDLETGETEWVPTEELQAAPTWQVREVLDSYMRDGQRYFLVDWEPTEEPRANLPQSVIAAFFRKRRALVRARFIEDEATEA